MGPRDTKSPYPQPGEVIDGKYQVERILGQGGMGAVVRAYHLLLRAPVALKFMNPMYVDVPGAVDRFLNEGVAAKAIVSDHVVKVDDVGKLPSGAPYLVMDCLDGRDLAQVLEQDGQPGVPPARVVWFALQILRALQAAHAAGIVHRDMKPSNCFVVTKDGEPDFVKILDFGISKLQMPGQQALTQTHSALGTPLYMSPEQARSPKDVDGRSDLYSVSVILYELLARRTPFTAESGQLTELLFKIFTADPEPLDTLVPGLPDGLAAVIHKGLSREPDARFGSALEMAEALEPFADERGRVLVAKMRTYVPPEEGSRFSRATARPSALAFSELGKGAVSAVLGAPGTVADAPRTEVTRPSAPPAGPSGTVAMGDRPSALPRISQMPPAHHVADATYPRPPGEHGPGVTAPALATTRAAEGDAEKSPTRLLVTGAAIALAAVVVAILVTRLGGTPATAVPSTDRPAPSPSPVIASPPPSSSSVSATPPAPSASGSVPVAASAPSVRASAPAPKPSSSAVRAVQQGLAN